MAHAIIQKGIKKIETIEDISIIYHDLRDIAKAISDVEKIMVKFLWKHKITKAILTKAKLDITISNFKTHYRTLALKIPWFWPQNKHAHF